MNKIDYSSFNWLALKINNESFQQHLSWISGRVIDLGCGTGQYKKDILKVADEYIGVDWKSGYHNQENVDVFANLTQKLPFQDNYADTVVSFQVMEHIPEPEFFLSECFRILKPGKKLILTVPFMWHVHESPFDYFRYTRYGLEYLLKKVGFVNLEIEENTGFWQTFILKFNYHTRRFSPGFLRYLWVPVWRAGQMIAPILDKHDNHPEECASYTVLAEKR